MLPVATVSKKKKQGDHILLLDTVFVSAPYMPTVSILTSVSCFDYRWLRHSNDLTAVCVDETLSREGEREREPER